MQIIRYSLGVCFARLCFGDEEQFFAETFSKYRCSGRRLVRTIDKPYKHSKKYKSTTLKNFSRKKVEKEPRIANNHTVKITNLYARVVSVRCFSGQ